MMTTDQIAKKCKVSGDNAVEQVLADLAAVQASGFEHGTARTYTTHDMDSESGDTDWYWAIGAEIERLEDMLDLREGTLLRIYRAAFREGAAAGKLAAKTAKQGKAS